MKTRCPDCQTTFRVTPEQLKVRAGKVRCGQCQSVFNALDCLQEEAGSSLSSITHSLARSVVPEVPAATSASVGVEEWPVSPPGTPSENDFTQTTLPDEPLAAEDFPPASEIPTTALPAEEEPLFSEADAHELGKATGIILPRDTREIPGYSKWAEGVVSGSFSLPSEKATRWPFVLAALILVLALAGQIVFRFRSEIAITMPSLRPMLETVCETFGADLPLPRHVELVSIEASDLESDPERANLLILSATLRNRASYGQAYPSLELSLTDTQDAAIARRVIFPGEYLSPKLKADQPFSANSDVAVRLWIEAKDISAAGYRLYVFYP